MEDIIIRLVNEAAEARNEKYESRIAYMKKTTAVHANAMGVLQYILENCHWSDFKDEKSISDFFMKVEMVYSWLDYTSALPSRMFLEIGSGDRIWRKFRNLYELYIKDIRPDRKYNSMTFVEWLEHPDQTNINANG